MNKDTFEDKKGFIFRCTNDTERECFERKLFGEKREYLPLVKRLKKGDLLFLYNCSTWQLSGTFEAVSDGAEGIIPDAWHGKFPAQIRFKEKTRQIKKISIDEVKDVILFFGIYPNPQLNNDLLAK